MIFTNFVLTVNGSWIFKPLLLKLTKQPKLTAIIQSRRLTLFGYTHTICMDDNADAKRILLASPPADWRRQPGRPRITWLSTIQQELKQHHLMLPEAADLAQNRPLWRMMSTYGAMQCQSCMPEMTTTLKCGLYSILMSISWSVSLSVCLLKCYRMYISSTVKNSSPIKFMLTALTLGIHKYANLVRGV